MVNPNAPRLKQIYETVIKKELMEKFGYRNIMQVPKLEKIVISRGIGAAVADKKLIEQGVQELALIAGQKPVVTKAKVDISNFKLRAGMPIGCKVTLRRDRMYEFLDRLINIAIPRTRDFRGLSEKGFDGRGNYTMGIAEQIVFIEIDIDKVYKIAGMDITFVTSAKTDIEALELLKGFGMPFKGVQKLV
ncbi:MAG: 50S ribosomal protein L5 [Bacteroidia bacterium]|nr:50S ribosomal protein L5 [Bacteroidia bacterium]MDW8159379.1 50S ribosomal protein L5 [Bacteroidia bacterium]